MGKLIIGVIVVIVGVSLLAIASCRQENAQSIADCVEAYVADDGYMGTYSEAWETYYQDCTKR